jgi:integrase
MNELVRLPDQATLEAFSRHAQAISAQPHDRPLLSDVAGSVSANTLRAYGSDVRAWTEWAQANARSAFPALPADVADYLRSLGGKAKASTIGRRVAAISWAHRAKGAPFDAKAGVITFALEAIRRQHGAGQGGKAPLGTAEIKAIVARLPDSLAGKRDRAIVLLGFASALRRSELAALDVSDVGFERDGLVLTIRRSKGDQHGKGQFVGVRYGRREKTCPVKALQDWLRAAGIGSGALFRPVRGDTVRPLRMSDRAIYDAIKAACARAGLDETRYGAHSLRSGHVTTALGEKADPIQAQRQLRHKSLDTTLGYDRRAASLRGSTSGKLGL